MSFCEACGNPVSGEEGIKSVLCDLCISDFYHRGNLKVFVYNYGSGEIEEREAIAILDKKVIYAETTPNGHVGCKKSCAFLTRSQAEKAKMFDMLSDAVDINWDMIYRLRSGIPG